MLRLYDNTRISDFRRCPRYFYYRHIRHWSAETISLPLIFGLGWHDAMDVVWKELCNGRAAADGTIIEEAYEAFLARWIAQGLPHPRELGSDLTKKYEPRTPMIALEMLHAYVPQRRNMLRDKDFQLLGVEHPFAVPLSGDDPDLFYIGRMDKVAKWRGRIYVFDHKTTTAYAKDGHFRTNFLEGFSPNSQVDGYIHAAHMEHGDEAKGAFIDGALVHRSDHDGFTLIPVDRQLAQLDAWLSDTFYWINQIEVEKERVQESTTGQYLKSFPKNTNSCQDYGTSCPYLGLCKGIANPEKMAEPPQGFVLVPWEPIKLLGLEDLAKATEYEV